MLNISNDSLVSHLLAGDFSKPEIQFEMQPWLYTKAPCHRDATFSIDPNPVNISPRVKSLHAIALAFTHTISKTPLGYKNKSTNRGMNN